MALKFELSKDESFHFELMRTLSLARYAGSDIGEVLQAAALQSLAILRATSMRSTVLPIAYVRRPTRSMSLRTRYLLVMPTSDPRPTFAPQISISTAIHPEDPRINDLWQKHLASFNKAIALLDVPAERLLLQADGFQVPAIFYRATGACSTPKPTFILGNGFDGAQEEMLHVFGFAALERGYNVITYEGPGQQTVRRQQGLGFIHDWEKVVTPVVDYLIAQPEVDSSRIALLGWSLGGYLAARAAAFEHRIAAVVAVDAVYELLPTFPACCPHLCGLHTRAGDEHRATRRRPTCSQAESSHPACGGPLSRTLEFSD